MTKAQAQSARDRLLALAKQRGEDFNFVLMRYGIERLVARLSVSPHAGAFVLKGATLFSVWSSAPHRATKDLDLLGVGEADLGHLAAIFTEVVAAEDFDDDGLVFDQGTIKAERIKEDADYQGVRVTGLARLGAARIPLQIDIGFGDAVTLPRSRSTSRPCSVGHVPGSASTRRRPSSQRRARPSSTSGSSTAA